jgi:hypothetical protein
MNVELTMPKGPRGEKRPADAIGLAVIIGKIANGEIEDEKEDMKSTAAQLGIKSGKAHARNLRSEQRSKIASQAAIRRLEKARPELETEEEI